MKRFFRVLKILGFSILIALGVYFLAAIVLSIIPVNRNTPKCEATEQLYLSSNGIHVDFVLPTKHLDDSLKNALAIDSSIQFVGIGWGDEKFFLETPTWDDLKWSTVLRSLLLKTPSVLHISHYTRKSKSWEGIALCQTQMENLREYISESFQRSEQQKFLKIGNFGYTQQDFFYRAKGSYNFINTCNIWVNRGLKKAEVKTAIWSPFEWGIYYHLD